MSKPSDHVSLPPKVAVDRYRKRLRDEDLNRGEANYAKSAIAGGLAGLALKLKRGPSRTGGAGKRAAIGAAAGVLAEAAIRRAGASTKDFYGERSRTAKKTEKIPVAAGLATAGILARRRFKALSRFEFSISPALKRKLAHGVALAGGIAVADSATHAVFPDKDKSRKDAAGKGLAQGAVYGSVLAGVEPQLLAKIRRHFSRAIGPIATGIPEAPYYFIRNVDPAKVVLFDARQAWKEISRAVRSNPKSTPSSLDALASHPVAGKLPRADRFKLFKALGALKRRKLLEELSVDPAVIEFRANDAEDLRSQRRKLAVLGGGALAGAVGLGLLARSGSKSRVVADLAAAAKKIPAGRGTVARLAKSNAIKTERGYVHLKPMAPGQRKRFDKLPGATQQRAGEIAAHTGNANFSPEERRRARAMLGAFRKQHNFSVPDPSLDPDFLEAARHYLYGTGGRRNHPLWKAVDKFKRRERNAAKKLAKAAGVFDGRGLSRFEFAEEAGIAAAIAKLARIRARGAGAVLPRLAKPSYTEAEKRLAKKMYPARLAPLNNKSPRRDFGAYPANGEGPQIVIVRKTKADRERDAFQHKVHVAEAVTGTTAGGIAIGTAAAKLAKWIGRRGVKNLSAPPGKIILFKRQQLREKEGDRFADPLYAAATGQHVYAHTENGERRSYGGDNAPLPLAHAQVLRAAYHKAGRVHKWGGRAVAAASDVGDVIGGRPRKVDYAGRPKKREWEKPYAKRVAETAALGAGVLGGALILKKNPRLRSKVLGGAARVRERVNRSVPDFFAGRKFTAPVHELAARFIAFDDLANFAGWDVRDPRGRSARVFAPGSRRRMRRDKEWHETAEGQRKIRNALIAATAAAAGGGGLLAGRHLLPKKAIGDVIKPRVVVPVKFPRV